MEIIWSPQSLEDIEEIGDFIAAENPERALSLIDELISSIVRLPQFPESGAIVEENPVFRHLFYEGYRAIYQFRAEKILIVTVLGPARLLK